MRVPTVPDLAKTVARVPRALRQVGFRRLQTRLTVLYAAMFGLVLTLVGASVYGVVAQNAERTIRRDLAASGEVFDRLWALKARQLQDSAGLLSRDFGFRAAAATADKATLDSALENLRSRLDVDRAFFLDSAGGVEGLDPALLEGGDARRLGEALDGDDQASGLTLIGGRAFYVIASPVLAPVRVGWVVFASRIDRAELVSLERLSAIPLKATLVRQARAGDWQVADAPRGLSESLSVERFMAGLTRIGAGAATPRTLNGPEGDAIALVKPLKTLPGSAPAALVLRYPIAAALAPYQPLLASVGVLGLLSLLLLFIGSWALARSVTRPIAALDDAAHRLQHGERVEVAVDARDEIGRLARSFNAMAAEIGDREAKITHLALHDLETNLPNHRALAAELEARFARPDRGRPVVLAIGVDRFRLMRGAIGHRLVGEMMRQLGARLTALRPDLFCARLTTADLAVVLTCEAVADAESLAHSLLAEMEGPIALGAARVDVGLTIGLAARGAHGDDVGALVEHATIALDQARAAHRKVAVFDAAAYGDPAANLSLMSEMRRAMADGALTLAHQPKLDLRRGAITGVEALSRWRHPVRGFVAPDLFVGMAEETGHIRALTEWSLDLALAEQALLRQAGHDLRVSVNLSGRLVGDRDFARHALARIAQTGGKISFEITETAVIDQPDAALELVQAYRDAGVPIAIDDYGSGLSSLAYLKAIAAQELKIDKAFVLALDRTGRDALLVKSTIDLAHGLGMQVTAEGVETAAAMALLSGMGCDFGQGYHIARPMAATALVGFLEGFGRAEPDATPMAGVG